MPLFIVALLILYSCAKPKDETGPNFNAFVLSKSANCGEAYLIKFDSNVAGLPNNYQDNTYIEINLAEEYKVLGKYLMLEFRTPTTSERIVCEESYITYPQIFITDAHD